ncbi:toll-like receptor 3 [Bradysia coprophila]|uniref:toll-like receptor 3 n=1 Tax=Bradysia coprophila TaxID=38358 RepID=UPI00187D7C71|nr:toll-like receptor 3 [Bradysia coprophila]
MAKMVQTFTAYSITAIFLLTALPTNSQEMHACDGFNGSTCIMNDISNLYDRIFYALYVWNKPSYGIKFTSSHFDELTSSEVNVVYDSIHSITNIDLSGNHIKIVKKFHFTIEGLLVANLSGNEIANLDSSSIFKAHPQLQTLDLSFNRITSIVSDAFDGLLELNYLNLNDNQLKVIVEYVFAPLVSLKDLELCRNLIEKFENYPFVHLVNLKKISLEKNNFSEFNFNLFERNIKLRQISLGDNYGNGFLSLIGSINFTAMIDGMFDVKLTKIIQSNCIIPAQSVFIKDSKLSELMIPTVVETIEATNSSITKLLFKDHDSSLRIGDFSRNSITGQLSFENCHKLEILDLSFNQIQSIRFSNQSPITDLNLSNNNLTLIHQTMTSLSNLKILDLSFNCIGTFEVHTFGNMISLEVLNLRQSCLKSLAYGTFSFQVNLRVLDISFNNLNSIDLELLSAQAELEELFIDGNNLTNIQSIDQIEIYLPRLRQVGLTHNNWSCETLSNLIKKFRQLRITVFVEMAISNTTNIKGIGCTARNSTQQTVVLPNISMPINQTAYMSKIEKINEIVETVNKLKDTRNYRESLDNAFRDLQQEKLKLKLDFNEQIIQLKAFGRGILHKFTILNDENSETLMKMKARILQLSQTNNEKYDLIVESIKSLEDKLKLIQLNEENITDNRKTAKHKIKLESDYRDDLGSIRTLEIILIVSLFVLLTVAIYYIYVYC